MSAGQLRSAFPCFGFRKTALALALSVLRLSPNSWTHSAPTMQGFNPLLPHALLLGPGVWIHPHLEWFTLAVLTSCRSSTLWYGTLHEFLRLGILQFDYLKPLKYGARDIKIFFGT
ncbi:hypothetical protein B0H19DRAFT_1117926 [Mycena capillaripes]|nr:hypothetical protein B0H19DRAFT_1117926 [Mycena capillaripes]